MRNTEYEVLSIVRKCTKEKRIRRVFALIVQVFKLTNAFITEDPFARDLMALLPVDVTCVWKGGGGGVFFTALYMYVHRRKADCSAGCVIENIWWDTESMYSSTYDTYVIMLQIYIMRRLQQNKVF